VVPPYRPHRGYDVHVHHPPVVHEYHPPRARRPSGHWEIYREWVPRRRERVWVPGYWEYGHRVRGHHEVRVSRGHYMKRKVWVDHGPRRHRPKHDRWSRDWDRTRGRKVRY
jgi:hypothetical protein